MVLFEEIYSVDAIERSFDKSESKILEEEHAKAFDQNFDIVHKSNIVFLLHGYLGETYDMEKIHNQLLQLIPDCKIHLISCLSGLSSLNIDDMATLVSEEMIKIITQWSSVWTVKKISLVGHSLGGIIFRAALKYLGDYRELFWAFITLATPHLGYFDSGNKLLSLGMWVVDFVSGSPSLSEIRLADDKEIEKTSLYKLSAGKGLDWFEVVVLVGSSQDLYSPQESALIQLSERLYDMTLADELAKMQARLSKKLSKWNVHRINVHFKFEKESFDNYIGRKAHIEFIDNIELIKMLIYRFKNELS